MKITDCKSTKIQSDCCSTLASDGSKDMKQQKEEQIAPQQSGEARLVANKIEEGNQYSSSFLTC